MNTDDIWLELGEFGYAQKIYDKSPDYIYILKRLLDKEAEKEGVVLNIETIPFDPSWPTPEPGITVYVYLVHNHTVQYSPWSPEAQ